MVFFILKIYSTNREKFNLNKYLEVLYVTPKSPILDLLKTSVHQIHIGLVDGVGGVDGHTIEDLVEEIVGDIEDEHDTENEDDLILSKLKLNCGRRSYRLEELEQFLILKFKNDDDEIFTVGGLVYSEEIDQRTTK